MTDELDQIIDRVEKTICETLSIMTGEARVEGRILAADFDVLTKYALAMRELRKEVAEGKVAILPAALTAENGMKAKLIGDFWFTKEIWDDEGQGYRSIKCVVPWTTIKEIHAAVVKSAPRHKCLEE